MTGGPIELPRRRLGRTGLDVSVLGLGGYFFTNEFDVPRAEALTILGRALANGVNYIDTAPVYGAGESEELVGRATASAPDVHISTKIGHFPSTIVRAAGDAAYLDETAMRRALEHSLHLLRRERVDILLIHEPDWPVWRIDRRTGDAPVTAFCEAARREGLVGAIGLGGHDMELIADLVATGRFDAVLAASHFDLAVRDAADVLFPVARRHDVGIIAGTPFRQGILAARQDDRLAEMRAANPDPGGPEARLIARIEAIYELADEAGIELHELSLRFLLSHDEIATIIPGPRTAAELEANLRAAARGPLPRDVLERLNELG